MYDNLDFKLNSTEVSNTNFLHEAAKYFDITGEHNFDGEFVLSGTLNNDFKITANRGGISIKGGSLCKWYLGDNFKTLGRGDTQRAIEKLSDTLHLPIDKATISRLDVAQNFIVKNPVEVYYNHFGEWKSGNKKSTRAPIMRDGKAEGLYYYQSNGCSVFYDKIKEQKKKGRPISELYQNRNVLRYEQRYTSRLAQCFSVKRVAAAMLYSEKFYIDLLNRYKDNYFAIKKINDVSLNFDNMKGKKDFYTMGILALMELQGGELNLMSQINEAYRSGKLSKKAAFDIRQAVQAASSEKHGITAKNDCILELDKKVVEAVKFCR